MCFDKGCRGGKVGRRQGGGGRRNSIQAALHSFIISVSDERVER